MEKQEENRGGFYFPGIVLIRDRRDADGFYPSQTADRTIRGLFIHTEEPLSKGERVFASVAPAPDAAPILIECEVVWARTSGRDTPGMAVRFVHISEHDRRVLDGFFRLKPR